jgi:hypothetical protein
MIKPLLIALSAILVLPNFVDRDIQPQQTYNGKEKFSPQLSFINSIEKLEEFTDNAAADKHIPIGSMAYMEILENVVAYRFYNGTSHKTLSDDWITAATDRITGTHYSCLVKAKDILQHPGAAPFQQNIVLMEVLKRKNIPFRETRFRDHFAIEVFVKDEWSLLDAGIEPTAAGQQPRHQNLDGHADILKKSQEPDSQSGFSYASAIAPIPDVHHSSNDPISRLSRLQATTGMLSKIVWLIPLVLLMAVRKRSFKMYAIKPIGKYVRMQPLRPVYNS